MEILDEADVVSGRMVQAFQATFPNLSITVKKRERARPVPVWMAKVRVKRGGQLVSFGARRHQVLAIGAALEGIPEWLRRLPTS